MRFNSGISCLSLTHLATRQVLNAPDEDIPELFDELEGANVLEDLGLGDLPRVPSSVSTWDQGRLPVTCFDLIAEPDLLGGRCDPTLTTVHEVTYDDCEEPWIICQCQDASGSVDRLIEDLGQLPVRARDYVRYVVMSDEKRLEGIYELQGSAVWWEGDLIIYGNWSSVGLFVHEVSHTMDYFVSGNAETPFSETREFEQILDDDTCVVDSYAKTTYSEAYAQAAVALAFDLNRSGPLDDVVDHDCMSGVHEVMEEHLGEYLTYDSSATCRTPLTKGRNICLSGDTYELCSNEDDNTSNEDDNTSNNDNDNDDDNTSNDDDTSNTDDDNSQPGSDNNEDNNDDDANTDGGDDESAAGSLKIGAVPMAVFWGAAQVFRAVGVM